jgi:mRNA-degrading endonuclease RelE of RelBE toxin-antitoxin system
MSYNIIATPKFSNDLKSLAKKYPSLKKEYPQLISALKQKPDYGTSIGNNCYKIRLAIKSKGKGKSGGARVITYLQIIHQTIYLLSIYDKSEKENISDKELKALLQLIKN